MSNSYAVNPIALTTTVASYKAAGGMPSSGAIFIDAVIWASPVTVADTFTMKDPAGNILLTSTCDVANRTQIFPMYGRAINDFSISQISSGTLLIQYH